MARRPRRLGVRHGRGQRTGRHRGPVANAESTELRWVPSVEVDSLNLHPGFANRGRACAATCWTSSRIDAGGAPPVTGRRWCARSAWRRLSVRAGSASGPAQRPGSAAPDRSPAPTGSATRSRYSAVQRVRGLPGPVQAVLAHRIADRGGPDHEDTAHRTATGWPARRRSSHCAAGCGCWSVRSCRRRASPAAAAERAGPGTRRPERRAAPPSRIAAAQVQSMPCEPRLNRKPRLAASATRNSLVSIEPITLRGSMRPLASSAGVPTGPQPPPPVASTNPANSPSGARKRLRSGLPRLPRGDAEGGEPDEDVDAEGQQDDRHDRRRDLGGQVATAPWRRRKRRPRRGCRSWRRPSSRRCRTSSGRRRTTSVVPISARWTVADAAAGLVPMASSRVVGGDAVGHAEAAVDELGDEADQGDEQKGGRDVTP